VNSFDIAVDSFPEKLEAPERIPVSTVDVSNGIGLSGSFDCVRRGRKALYGFEYAARVFERAGIPYNIVSRRFI
jgi:hypothetical protein